jgi:hypothetical protein
MAVAGAATKRRRPQTADVHLWSGRSPPASASGAIGTLAETWLDNTVTDVPIHDIHLGALRCIRTSVTVLHQDIGDSYASRLW